ncbi:hypothetical protein EDC01DRAFT_729729 [Geopyxis carbonaria]|nr:hypothetical protein EDC01DRAFT_729729 [Geopyxis carbonaria]
MSSPTTSFEQLYQHPVDRTIELRNNYLTNRTPQLGFSNRLTPIAPKSAGNRTLVLCHEIQGIDHHQGQETDVGPVGLANMVRRHAKLSVTRNIQNAALSHDCDYSPRVVFRNDTGRIIERHPGIITEGCGVWGSERIEDQPSASPRRKPEQKFLAKFSKLTNDEDREQKAAGKIAGTYHVVYNFDTFNSYRKYESDDSIESNSPIEDDADYRSIIRNQKSNIQNQNDDDDDDDTDDDSNEPRSVILREFEEPNLNRRSVTSGPSSKFRRNSISPVGSLESETLASQSSENDESNSKHHRLCIQYYREIISPRIFKMHDMGFYNPGQLFNTMDVFEAEKLEEFIDFLIVDKLKLLNAIQALSVFSWHYRGNSPKLDRQIAVRNYQECLSLLPKSHVLSQRDHNTNYILQISHIANPEYFNGRIYMHFILLMFEILNPNTWVMNLGQSHISQIATYIEARERHIGREIHPLLVWNIAVIDTYALLSGGGGGHFIHWLVRTKNTLEHTYQFRSVDLATPQPLEIPDLGILPTPENILLFQNKVVIVAAKLGRLSRQNMQNLGTEQLPPPNSIPYQNFFNHLIQELHELQKKWNLAHLSDLREDFLQHNLSPHIYEIYVQSIALHAASIIFSLTCIWQNQRKTITERSAEEINAAVGRIMYLTDRHLKQLIKIHTETSSTGIRFGSLVFPLFLAGIEARDHTQKTYIAKQLQQFQIGAIGKNIRVFSDMLHHVYSVQRKCGMDENFSWQKLIQGSIYKNIIIFDY